jgi:hypothetical protein
MKAVRFDEYGGIDVLKVVDAYRLLGGGHILGKIVLLP